MTQLRLLFSKKISRFRADARGATAVEFAFVAVPFFAIIFAIMQTSLVIFANQALQTATGKASRLIMTGEAQNGSGLTAFKNKLCADIEYMFKCSNIWVEVKSFTGFNDPALQPGVFNTACFDLDENEAAPNGCWAPGGPSQVNFVRVAYKWPFGVALGEPDMTLVAVTAFVNEPY